MKLNIICILLTPANSEKWMIPLKSMIPALDPDFKYSLLLFSADCSRIQNADLFTIYTMMSCTK